MLSRRFAAAFIVCLAAFSATVILYNAPRAQGAETPPPACDPKLAYDTVCGRDQMKDGKPTGIKGGVGCKCTITDKTSGKSVPGICNSKKECTGGDKPKDAENRDAKQCLKPEDCPSGTSPGGSPPGGGAPGGGAGGDQKPQPDTRTPEQKRIDEAFKALQDPKPDEKPVLKPDEKAIPMNVITEEEYLKQCPTCKPFSEIGKSQSLYQQAFNGTPMDQQGFLKNTEKQPSSVLSGEITDPSNVSKIDDGLGKNTFEPQPTNTSERDRINSVSTFEPVDSLGNVQDRTGARVTTPGNPTMDVTKDDGSGLVTKLGAKGDVNDQQWGEMVKQAQREMAQNCPSGFSCIMVNNESAREMTVHYSRATDGKLPEGASVLTPNQDKLGSAGGVWSSLTGSGPTTGDVAQVLQKEGASLTMPDGREVRVAFNEASAKALAPSIANAYDPNESSVWGRLSSATGFNGDKIAEGDFVARDPNKPIAVQTQTVTETPQETPVEPERQPTRITVTPRETSAPVEVVDSRNAPPAPKIPTETPADPPTETRPPTRVYISPTPNDVPPPPTDTRPAATPPTETRPAATPPTETRPAGTPPSDTPPAPPSETPPRTQPSTQAQTDPNLFNRLYCLIFTCQSPQQQAQQPSVPSMPSIPPSNTQPAQQFPTPVTPQRPVVVQTPPTQTPPTQTPPAQTPPSNTPPSNTPPAVQTPPAATQPATTQPTAPAPRTAPTQLATNNGVSNVAPPQWTQPTPAQQAASAAKTPPQPAPAGTAPRGNVAPANGVTVPANAASAPRATNPVAINNAAQRLVQQAAAQADARSSAPSSKTPVTGEKTPPTLAVEKSNETVPATAAAKKTDVAVNNPNAGGTAGEPLPRTDTTPRKAELAVAPGPAGKVSDKQTPPTTPTPEVKRPTDGPSPTGKVGTGGSGVGNGTGLGNGNGSEAGVQAPSTCGVKCLAQKALSKLAGLTGVTPANATPAPTMTAAQAQKLIADKVTEVTAQIRESEKLGESVAALEPLRQALKSGREAAEIANNVNNPAIKGIAGDLNKRVLEIQALLQKWDKSHYLDGSAAAVGDQMNKTWKRQKGDAYNPNSPSYDPNKDRSIPAAFETLAKLNKALSDLAKQPADAPLTNQPQPASRTPGNVTPNNQPPAQPAARRFDSQVKSAVAPGGRAHVYANITNPATAKVVYGMYGIGGSVEDTMNPSKNNIGQQVRNSNCNCVLVVPDTGNAPGRKGGSTAGALANSQGANDLDQEMNNTIAQATGLPKETVAKMNRQVVFHSGGFQPAVAMVQAIGKKIDSIQALDGMYGNAPQVIADWKKGFPEATLTSLCAVECAANQQLEDALKAGGVPVNKTPGTVPKGATVARASNDHFGVMTNGDPVKQFVTQTGTDGGLAGQPQPASRTPADQNVAPPKNPPNIPGKFNPLSGQHLSNAVNSVCKAVGNCNAPMLQQALGGVCGIESAGCNAQMPHKIPGSNRDSQYQGFGQLGYNETNRAIATLDRLTSSQNLSEAEKQQMRSVVAAARAQQQAGQNPNKDSVLGPWMLAGLHGALGSLQKVSAVTTDPRLGAAYLMNAQLAPVTFQGDFNPNYRLSPSAVAQYNKQGPSFWIPMGTTIGQAAQQVVNSPNAGSLLGKGVAFMQQFTPDGSPAPVTSGNYATGPCAYQGCSATPTIQPGNRGYSPNVNRVAQVPTSGLYYSDPHTGAIGVPADPNMTREQFTQAAREDAAMERLAQQGKLPQGSAFRNFTATRVQPAPGTPAAQPQVVTNPNHRFDTRYGYPSIAPAAQRGGFVAQGQGTPSRLNNTMQGGRLPWGSNPEIYKPLEEASKHLPPGYTVSLTNSGRTDHSHNHGTFVTGPDGSKVSRASDMVIYDPNGKPLANIQSPQNFGLYRELAQNWKHYHDKMYPDRASLPRWGGGFTDVQADMMHLDLNAARGNGAFSWETGLSRSYAQFGTPDQVGVGMGNTSTYQPINQSAVGNGQAGVPVQQPGYDITDQSGQTVARNVPLPDGTVGQNGEVRLLSNKDGLPMNAGGERIKDGESPLKISSDQTLPKADREGEGLKFKDERPTQPAPHTHDPWSRRGPAGGDVYGYRANNRPTSTCVDNNGQLYGCTPTGGSNPTGGSSPTGGGGAFRPSQVAQQNPPQYPIQTPPPYPFPQVPVIPPPVIQPSLSPSLSCSPSSVPYGTSTPVMVQWSCLTGSASSTGFATGGIPTGKTTMTSSRTGTTTLRFFLQCTSGVRVGPVATCSVPVVTPQAPLVSLSVDPNPVNVGGSAIVIWGSSNATSCSLKATSTAELIDGSVNGSTSTKPLFMNTPITLTCKNAAGITASSTIQIRVRNDDTPSS